MSEKNTFVFDPEHPLKSSLEIPGGRETYINYMLEYEGQTNIDDGFTEDENKTLYGLQFDEAQAFRMHEEGVIPKELFELIQEGANYQKSKINTARHERRQKI